MVLRTIEKVYLGLEVGVEIRVEKNIMFEQFILVPYTFLLGIGFGF